jgi:Flp pilus assembly protein TadG
MKRRSSDRQRGVIIVFLSLALVCLMLAAGLVVDLGMAYVTHGRLTKAVDAGALAGAKESSRSNADIETIVRKVASANYTDIVDTSYDVKITTPATDTKRIAISARTHSPAVFTRIVGRESFDVAAAAEAMRYPLDTSFVLDLSQSLQRNNAFDDMQDASVSFLQNFDDTIDQFGLVTYSTWAEQRMPLRKNFKSAMSADIRSRKAISDTNIDEGLRLAKVQLDNTAKRANAVRIVVLFTDGRPTAFGDTFTMPSGTIPRTYNGIVATSISGSGFRGLFRTTDGLKIVRFSGGNPVTTANNSSTATDPSATPPRLPDGSTTTGGNIRRLGTAQAELWATDIRKAGYTIYTIGLGSLTATDPGDQPDLPFLRRIANENGVVSSTQPQGAMLFAPSPDDLEAVFAKLADRILTRLTR